MRNKRILFFAIFILVYITGLFAGVVSEIRSDNQAEIYSYLEASVGSYNVPIKSSIRGVFEDNIKMAAVLLLGGLFKISPVISGALLCFKGYTSGFASIASLRLFGIKGLLLCISNFISSMLIIPIIAVFSVLFMENQEEKLDNKWIFYKRYLIFSGIILGIFAIDTVFRGVLSSVCMNVAREFLVK